MPKREEKKSETKHQAITFTMSNGAPFAYRVTEDQVETVLEVLEEDPAVVLIDEQGILVRLNADHIVSVHVGPKYPGLDTLPSLDEVY